MQVDHDLVKHGMTDVPRKESLHLGGSTQEVTAKDTVQGSMGLPGFVKEADVILFLGSHEFNDIAVRIFEDGEVVVGLTQLIGGTHG